MKRILFKRHSTMMQMEIIHDNMTPSVIPSSPVSMDDVDTATDDISSWLSGIGMQKYDATFIENGYGSLSMLQCIENTDALIEIGITKEKEQQLFLAEIGKLKCKPTQRGDFGALDYRPS